MAVTFFLPTVKQPSMLLRTANPSLHFFTELPLLIHIKMLNIALFSGISL
jgi:hypothetical protein